MKTSPSSPTFIGVDIAKAEVVAAVYGQATSCTQANTRQALAAWLKTLPPDTCIGLESTGGYHELLALLAHRAGFTVYLLNPRDVRHYAKALGKRAKTDHVDALLLARFVAHEHTGLHPWQPPTPEQRHLDRLLKRRATLVKAHGMMRQTLAHVSGLAQETQRTFKAMKALLDAIDRQIEAALSAQEALKQKADCVRSTPGIGLLTGAALVNLFSRLPTAGVEAVVAFTGLDPRPCDSGQKRGVRRLSKRGPAELRRLLFNAAMSAARTAAWRPFYERERTKGLSSTAALVCLARRLLRTAFVLFHSQTRFNPEKLSCRC
jgi:transposase